MEISKELNPAMVDWLKNAGWEPSNFTEEGLLFVTELFNAIQKAREEIVTLDTEIASAKGIIQSLKQSSSEDSNASISVEKMIEIQKQLFAEEQKLADFQQKSLNLSKAIAQLKA